MRFISDEQFRAERRFTRAVADWIRDRREAMGLTLKDMQRRGGMTYETARHIEDSRGRNLRLIELWRALRALDAWDADHFVEILTLADEATKGPDKE